MGRTVVGDDDASLQPHLRPQIAPVRVIAFHQINLPIAVPVFEVLFASNGLVHGREHLNVHQPFAIAAFREAFEGAFLVLVVSRGHV